MNNPYIARVLDFNVNNKIDYSVKKRPAPSLAIELKPNLDASGITIVADENGEPIALDDGYGRPIPLDDSPIQSSKKRKSTKMPSKKKLQHNLQRTSQLLRLNISRGLQRAPRRCWRSGSPISLKQVQHLQNYQAEK